MGIIHKKENEEKIIEELCKNKHINLNNPSFYQVKVIINYYLSLKEKLNKQNAKIEDNQHHHCLFSSSNTNDNATIKRHILRIRKWINMVHSSQPFIRRQKKLFTYQQNTKILTTPNNKQSIHSLFNVPTANSLSLSKNPHHSNNLSRNGLSESKTSSIEPSEDNEDMCYTFNYKSDTACYNNTYIEHGVCTFYRKNKAKFIERLIKGPPKGFIIPSWISISEIPIPRLEDIYQYYLHIDPNSVIKKMILRDIHRTFPVSEYPSMTIDYPNLLYHLLKAFANVDTQLGYCQGMNFIVAFILLATEWNEEDTFFILIALFSNTFKDNLYSIRGFFIEGFPLLLYFNYVFGMSFEYHMPKLFKHFNDLGIPLDVWVGRWFQTLFTVILPIDWCIRLWNCLFVYGNLFMIKFAIVFMQVLESDLLELNDEQEVMKYFSNVQQFPLSNDSENLSHKCSIDKLIRKANKIAINDCKEKYIKEMQPDFDKILEEDIVKVYDLSVETSFIKKQFIDNDPDDEDEVNSDNDKKRKKNNNNTLERISESNYENYNEEIDEDNISSLPISAGLDRQKSISVISYKIEQNIREHELDFRLLKSQLDTSETSLFKKYNSIVITNTKPNIINQGKEIESKFSSDNINIKNSNTKPIKKKYFQAQSLNHNYS